MEISGWLAAASLIGAVLGFIGAAGGAAFGGRIPPAERGRTPALPSRVLLIASALALGVAAAMAVAVIPGFAADTSPGATPDRAVPGLGIMAVLNVYAGVAFLIAKSAKSGRANRAIAATTGLLAIAMGATMAAAASAAVDHLHIGLGAVGARCHRHRGRGVRNSGAGRIPESRKNRVALANSRRPGGSSHE
jgi:hypothetical protein